ncbi:hypothetical protein [Halochromatium glycolicum]|uniref:hypothetical protein n=1 Tax=Halochromatium glycolicum TaxID=85075 RepID=UPI00190B5437|nr:hypothetical protein [Halochromatium glycolicum]
MPEDSRPEHIPHAVWDYWIEARASDWFDTPEHDQRAPTGCLGSPKRPTASTTAPRRLPALAPLILLACCSESPRPRPKCIRVVT